MVGGLLLTHYPEGGQLEGSAAAFRFSLVMIPALAAPMAVLLHIYAVRNHLLAPVVADSRLPDGRCPGHAVPAR